MSREPFDPEEDTGNTALGGPDARWRAARKLAADGLDPARAGWVSFMGGSFAIVGGIALACWAMVRIASGEPRPQPDPTIVLLMAGLVAPIGVGFAVAVHRRALVPGWRRASGALTRSERRWVRRVMQHELRTDEHRAPVVVAEAVASRRQLAGAAWLAPGIALLGAAVVVVALADGDLDGGYRGGDFGLLVYVGTLPFVGGWFVREHRAGTRYLRALDRGELRSVDA